MCGVISHHHSLDLVRDRSGFSPNLHPWETRYGLIACCLFGGRTLQSCVATWTEKRVICGWLSLNSWETCFIWGHFFSCAMCLLETQVSCWEKLMTSYLIIYFIGVGKIRMIKISFYILLLYALSEFHSFQFV